MIVIYILVGILIFIIGFSCAISHIKNSINEYGYYTISGIILHPQYSNNLKISEDQSIIMLAKIKNKYNNVSIDESIKIWKEKGYIYEYSKNKL